MQLKRGKRSTGKIVITREKYIGAHVDGSPGPTKQHPVQGWASTRSDNGPTDNTTCLAPWIPGASPPPVVKHAPSTLFEPCQAQCDSGGSGLHLAMPPRWSEHNWKLSGVDISAQITARTTVQLVGPHSVRHPTTPPPRSEVDEEEMVAVLFPQ